mmetsp:Transcript_1381/g.4133  ORF Transcript_1381/g.4133 Transcript_1381/m.4133 type:complete len:537 (-) Transcript_1381:672-2282(-)
MLRISRPLLNAVVRRTSTRIAAGSGGTIRSLTHTTGRWNYDLSNVDRVWAHRGQAQLQRHFATKTKSKKKSDEHQTVVQVPEMGESIVEGTVSAFLKNPGDKVQENDIICQIETDKITVDIRAPGEGKIKELKAETGDTVSVGQDIIVLSPSEVNAPGSPEIVSEVEGKSTAADSQQDIETAPILVPEMGESITEGTLIAWMKNVGDKVSEDEVIAQIETDKITVEVRAPKSGIIVERSANENETVAVGKQIAAIRFGEDVEGSESKQETSQEPAEEQKSPPPPPSSVTSEEEASMADSDEDLGFPNVKTGERRVIMTNMRKRIAERLKEAQNTAAILTTFNEVDMSALMALRSDYKEDFFKKHKVKLGFMSAFVKACTTTLQEQPEVNAYIDAGEIVYRDYVDVSVAVSTPTGLVVPVLRGCERMSFADIEKTIFQLGEKAKTNSLTIAELQGGTFTISNGGIFGSLLSTPIINMPQSAILGMHAIQRRPVVVKDQVSTYVALVTWENHRHCKADVDSHSCALCRPCKLRLKFGP